MASTKTATLTFRFDPQVKEALRTAAQKERRSITNMVEVLVLDYCGRNGIQVPPDQGAHRETSASPTTA